MQSAQSFSSGLRPRMKQRRERMFCQFVELRRRLAHTASFCSPPSPSSHSVAAGLWFIAARLVQHAPLRPNPTAQLDPLRRAGLARQQVRGTFSATGPSPPAAAVQLASTLGLAQRPSQMLHASSARCELVFDTEVVVVRKYQNLDHGGRFAHFY